MPTIILPGGYRPEDGKGPGDEVKALVTIKLSDDGKSGDIIDIDGAKFEETREPGAEEEKTEGDAPPESDDDSSQEAFGSRLQAAMSEMKGGGAQRPMM